MTSGSSPGADTRTPNVELADGECVHKRDGIVGHAVGHPARHQLRDEHQPAEGAWCVRIVPDHERLLAVADHDRQAGDACADREFVRAVRPVTDHLADEFMAHDGVAVGVPFEPVGRVRMVHVVHVRCADRRGQRLDQQFTGAWHRVVGLAHLELSAAQHHRAHQPAVPCLAAESSEAAVISSTSVRRSAVHTIDAIVRFFSPTT